MGSPSFSLRGARRLLRELSSSAAAAIIAVSISTTTTTMTLAELEERAAQELRQFTVDAGPGDIKIPDNVLRAARGIGIHWGGKAGALVSLSIQRGVVVARLPDGKWSCPVPVRQTEASVGLTLGGERKSFITIIPTARGIDHIKTMLAGAPVSDVSFALGPVGGTKESAAEIRTGEGDLPIYVYTSDPSGLMISADVGASWYSAVESEMKEWYGEHATEEAILSGLVRHPDWPQSPLNSALQEVAPEAEVAKVGAEESGLHPARFRAHVSRDVPPAPAGAM